MTDLKCTSTASVKDLSDSTCSFPMQKFWKSDFQLHVSEKSSSSPSSSEAAQCRAPRFTNDPPLICVSDEVSARESLADASFLCDQGSGSNSRNEHMLAETIKNVSRECLDRLAKLESENKELRKQYETLEAQITPLVKSLKAEEGYQHWTSPPENGRTAPAPVNCSRNQFDAQLRQLVSVLVHTNIAQNDIREDCRYLKHRVSNLETINAKLFDLIQNQCHFHCNHSCQELPRHNDAQAEHWSLEPADEPRPMFPNMQSKLSHLTVHRSEGSLRPPTTNPVHHARTMKSETTGSSTVNTSLAGTLDQSDSLAVSANPKLHKSSPMNLDQPCITSVQSEKAMVPSLCVNGNTLCRLETDVNERLLTGCFQSVLEGVLLRASSTPQFPLPDRDFSHPSELPDPDVSHKQPIVPLASTNPEWLVTNGGIRTTRRRTSVPLLRSEQHQNPHTDAGIPVRRNSLSTTDDPLKSVLLPHAWLHMSILPETGIRRHPIGTRSHIILGARSLPLCMNQPLDISARSNSASCVCNGSRSSSREATHNTRYNAAVLATIGSPLANRQPRTFHTDLNPIQEVDSKGESYYDFLSGTKCVTAITSSHSSSSNSDSSAGVTQNRQRKKIPANASRQMDESPQKQIIPNQKHVQLKRMRRILCKDLKRRYLCPLRLLHHMNTWDITDRVPVCPRTVDLELASYQQTVLHKCRDSQRNLRYGVYSDTELLTGKFTITSRDDSAIDTGEDEVQSSRESIEEETGTTPQQRDTVTLDENQSPTNPHLIFPDEVHKATQNSATPEYHTIARCELLSVGENSREFKELHPLEQNTSIPVIRTQSPVSTTSESLSNRTGNTESSPISIPVPIILTQVKNCNDGEEEEEADQNEDDEDGDDHQQEVLGVRVTRQNMPPPVVIHRRRFTGISEPVDNTVMNDESHREKDSDSLSKQPQQIRQHPQQSSQESACCSQANVESSLKQQIQTSGSSVLRATETTIDSLDSPVYTTITTSSTTDSTSGSDLNEISLHLQPLKGSSRSNWSARRASMLVPSTHVNGLGDETTQLKQQAVSSSGFAATNLSTARNERHRTEAVVEPVKVGKNHRDNSALSNLAGARHALKAATSKATKALYTPTQVTHSTTVNSNRPATSPRSRRDPLIVTGKPETTVKIMHSRRTTAGSHLTALSKSSPNSPDYSLAGQRALRTSTTSPKKRAVTKTELSLPNHQNGGAPSSYSRRSTQVICTNISPNRNRDGPESLRMNGHGTSDLSVPAPPPIPPRTTSRTQGYQTKTTVTRSSAHSIPSRTPPNSEANSPFSAKPIPIELNHERFGDSPQFRSSSHSRNCSPSSSSGYGYSPQLYSSGMMQHAYQPVTCAARFTDSGRNATSTPLQSLYPRLPVPVVRRDSLGYGCSTRQPDHAAQYYVPLNGHSTLHFDSQLTNCSVSTRGVTPVSGSHLNIPQTERRAYRRASKDYSELIGTIGNADGWDRRGYNQPTIASNPSSSRWSQTSRDCSVTPVYSKERPV